MIDYFPNGLPRYVLWYEEEDGIKYFTGRDGERLPLLDDHFIICDTKKSYVVNTFYPHVTCYGQGPMEIDMYSEYHENEEDAMADAKNDQRRFEEEGLFIPIYHRR